MNNLSKLNIDADSLYTSLKMGAALYDLRISLSQDEFSDKLSNCLDLVPVQSNENSNGLRWVDPISGTSWKLSNIKLKSIAFYVLEFAVVEVITGKNEWITLAAKFAFLLANIMKHLRIPLTDKELTVYLALCDLTKQRKVVRDDNIAQHLSKIDDFQLKEEEVFSILSDLADKGIIKIVHGQYILAEKVAPWWR